MMWRTLCWMVLLAVAVGSGWAAEPKKEAEKKAAPKRVMKKGTNYKLFIEDVYKAEPNIEAALQLTPEQIAKLDEATRNTVLADSVEDLRQKSLFPDLSESAKKTAKERYDRAVAQAQREYERACRSILTPGQLSTINRINDGLARNLQTIRTRYGERGRGQPERVQTKLREECNAKIQEEIDRRIDSVLTDEQKKAVGRETN